MPSQRRPALGSDPDRTTIRHHFPGMRAARRVVPAGIDESAAITAQRAAEGDSVREHEVMESATIPTVDQHEMQGRAEVRRVGRVRFPVFELVQGDVVLASMGRTGWVKVFLGRGQRIELADGSRWRLTSLGAGGAICPAILDDAKRKIAVSSVAVGGYGINGMTFGFTLHLGDRNPFGRANRWVLRFYEDEIATVMRHPSGVDAAVPVHLGAVLIAFALARYGIVGESRPRFSFRWD